MFIFRWHVRVGNYVFPPGSQTSIRSNQSGTFTWRRKRAACGRRSNLSTARHFAKKRLLSQTQSGLFDFMTWECRNFTPVRPSLCNRKSFVIPNAVRDLHFRLYGVRHNRGKTLMYSGSELPSFRARVAKALCVRARLQPCRNCRAIQCGFSR